MSNDAGWIDGCLTDTRKVAPSATEDLLTQIQRFLEGPAGDRPLTAHEIASEARTLLKAASRSVEPEDTPGET